MHYRESVDGSAPIAHSVSARNSFDAIGSALTRCEEFGLVDAIAVLRNLHSVGTSAPVALEVLSEKLEPHLSPDLKHAFTVQIAQHYIDDARDAVEAAAEAVEHAMNALISLLEES